MRYFHEAIPPQQPSVQTGEREEEKEQTCRPSPRRSGATAMEYLFVISLILCAGITAIGYLGQSAKTNMQNSSNAVQKATSSK